MSEAKKATYFSGIVAVLIGIVGGIFCYLAVEEQNTLKTRGVWVNATVIGKDREFDDGRWNYWLEYVYADGEGQKHEAWEYVTLKSYQSARLGAATFPISYLPQDPSRHLSRESIEDRFNEFLLIGLAVLAFIGFGLIVVAIFLRTPAGDIGEYEDEDGKGGPARSDREIEDR